MSLTWPQRIDNYTGETGFPRSLFVAEDGRIVGTWIMGNDYRVKPRTPDEDPFWGGYPAGYLRRVKALFPDRRRVLHLFSGKVDLETMPGCTVDIDPALGPDIVDDAQSLADTPLDLFDLVLCDPPYSVEDAEHYTKTMIKRNKVMAALGRCSPDTFIVWLDQVLPMYRKDMFSVEACVGLVKSTNHRFRMMTVFRRR